MPSKPVDIKEEFKYQPSICIKMKKEMAKGIGMGDKVSAHVSGTVTGIRECFDDKSLVDVDLKPFQVKTMGKDMEEENEDGEDED